MPTIYTCLPFTYKNTVFAAIFHCVFAFRASKKEYFHSSFSSSFCFSSSASNKSFSSGCSWGSFDFLDCFLRGFSSWLSASNKSFGSSSGSWTSSCDCSSFSSEASSDSTSSFYLYAPWWSCKRHISSSCRSIVSRRSTARGPKVYPFLFHLDNSRIDLAVSDLQDAVRTIRSNHHIVGTAGIKI